jgi:hypothetical protein
MIRKKVFLREYSAFWMLVGTGERQFDPAWLAQLCLVVATALQAKDELQTEDMQAEDLYLLSKACLDVSCWLSFVKQEHKLTSLA